MALRFMCKLDPKEMVLQEIGEKKGSWVQIFRKGQWEHPRYGKLQFTDEIFNGFIKNFNDRVRKVDIAIDTEHEPEKGACGWIKQLDARSDGGLWGFVEWTTRGLQLVADGVFKYLSGDFDYEWKDEESGKKFKNVLFGAALTNRPFIKGMSPINLSEFKTEIENDEDVRNNFQLAEDILKLKEGNKVKTDAEIMACKNEADLTPEELARKKELMKQQDEEMQLAKKKALSERAVKLGLKEDAKEEEVAVAEKLLADNVAALAKRAEAVGLKPDATLAEIEKAEKAAATKKFSERVAKAGLKEPVELAELEAAEKKLAEVITPENEQTVKVAVALGLSATSSLAEIYAAASKFVASVQGKIQGSPTLAERAKAIGLSEKSTKEEVETKEKELSEKKAKEEADSLMKAEVPALEKKLSEMKASGADAFTVKLLEETIFSKKKLREEQVKNSKEKIELKLKEHFRAGKLTAKERDVLKTILCSEVETGETSFKLSEKDKDGKPVEATKTLSDIVDAILTDRPAIIELQEIAKKELQEPPKEGSKELSEGEVSTTAQRVAGKVTGSTKSRKLAERALRVGLPATATLSEIEAKEKE